MIKRLLIYNPYYNQNVTEEYVSTIEAALKSIGAEVERVRRLEKNKQSDIAVLVVTVADAIRARRKCYDYVLLWSQGIIPEESFMRKKSMLRYRVLSAIEKKGLNSADYVFLISEAMKVHYLKKYNFQSKNEYIMPCFNSVMNREAYMSIGKYTNNVFLYAGGMQVWQCFEKTVKLYKEIESVIDNAFFRVLTSEQIEAERILKKYDVKHYSVSYVQADEIGEEMKNAKFGFSLREDTPMNRVATPTKLSTYIAHGVIPIYSDCLHGFGVLAANSPYCIGINNNDVRAVEIVISICKKEIMPEDVYASFSDTFGKYYSKERHINMIANQLKGIFK